jgi:type II secretory pathway component PulF
MYGLLVLSLFVIVPLVVATRLWLNTRRARAYQAVQTLASIVGQNLPLTPMLDQAARSERRGMGRVYRDLQQLVDAGQPLSSAVQAACPACPGEVVSTLRAGEQGGTLPTALRQVATEYRDATQARTESGLTATYLIVLATTVLVLLVSLSWFHMVMVVPKYIEIMRDFGVDEPATQALGPWDLPLLAPFRFWVAFAQFFAAYQTLILSGLVAGVIIALQLWFGSLVLTRHPDRAGWWFGTWDTLTWYLPLVRRPAEHAALARQLSILAAAVRAGHDLPAAADQAGLVAVNIHARRRLRHWALELKAGDDPAAAARACGLPAPLATAIRQSASPAELAGALAYLAEYHQTLVRHWRRIVAATVAPVLIVLCGVLVAIQLLAFFGPLVALIEGVAEWM